MRVNVLFFGVLTDVTNSGFRVYEDVPDTDTLKVRISDDFPSIVHYSFRIAVNNEIINENRVLKDGDEAALLPPFAGG